MGWGHVIFSLAEMLHLKKDVTAYQYLTGGNTSPGTDQEKEFDDTMVSHPVVVRFVVSVNES